MWLDFVSKKGTVFCSCFHLFSIVILKDISSYVLLN